MRWKLNEEREEGERGGRGRGRGERGGKKEGGEGGEESGEGGGEGGKGIQCVFSGITGGPMVMIRAWTPLDCFLLQ